MIHFSAYSVAVLRYLLASAVLMSIAAAFKIRPPAPRDWGGFIASGAVGFFFYVIVFNFGTRTENSAAGSVILATAPVITALLASVVYGERLSAMQWCATAVEFAGIVALATVRWASSGERSFRLGPGVLWLLLAAVILGVYNILQRRLTRSYSGLQASMYSILAGTVMLAIFTPAAMTEAANAAPKYLGYIAVLGIFPSAIAYVSWSVALEKGPGTSSVSNYMFLGPFFAALLGFILSRERPDLGTIVGGVIILLGVLLFNKSALS
jgi:drug/metabolite transporter (DMT)-like permease